MHTGHPQKHKQGNIRRLFYFYFIFFVYVGGKKSKLKKIKQEEFQEKENYIQQGRIEITLKEHSGRAYLPVPHYSPTD